MTGKFPAEWFAWRDPIEILPDAAFDTPGNHVRSPRTALGRNVFDMAAARSMAGFAFRPSFIEFSEFARSASQSPLQRGFINELIVGLHPVELRVLHQDAGLTTFEMARAMRNSHITHPYYADWINRMARGYSTPEPLACVIDYWFPLNDRPQFSVRDVQLRDVSA